MFCNEVEEKTASTELKEVRRMREGRESFLFSVLFISRHVKKKRRASGSSLVRVRDWKVIKWPEVGRVSPLLADLEEYAWSDRRPCFLVALHFTD